MTSSRRTASHAFVVLLVALAITGCDTTPERSPGELSPAPSPLVSTIDDTPATDLSAIGCATDNPADVGELTGAWAGNDSGVYYIRHVGDCVWWFGTEVREIERGTTGQPGFANVASGRVVGTQIDLEWADVPLGNVLGGGGLTFVYADEKGQLTLTEQRGDWQPFGGSVLTRIEPEPATSGTLSASPTP